MILKIKVDRLYLASCVADLWPDVDISPGQRGQVVPVSGRIDTLIPLFHSYQLCREYNLVVRVGPRTARRMAWAFATDFLWKTRRNFFRRSAMVSSCCFPYHCMWPWSFHISIYWMQHQFWTEATSMTRFICFKCLLGSYSFDFECNKGGFVAFPHSG